MDADRDSHYLLGETTTTLYPPNAPVLQTEIGTGGVSVLCRNVSRSVVRHTGLEGELNHVAITDRRIL